MNKIYYPYLQYIAEHPKATRTDLLNTVGNSDENLFNNVFQALHDEMLIGSALDGSWLCLTPQGQVYYLQLCADAKAAEVEQKRRKKDARLDCITKVATAVATVTTALVALYGLFR